MAIGNKLQVLDSETEISFLTLVLLGFLREISYYFLIIKRSSVVLEWIKGTNVL